MDDVVFAALMFLAGSITALAIEAFAEHPPRPLITAWNALAHPRRRKEHHRG